MTIQSIFRAQKTRETESNKEETSTTRIRLVEVSEALKIVEKNQRYDIPKVMNYYTKSFLSRKSSIQETS